MCKLHLTTELVELCSPAGVSPRSRPREPRAPPRPRKPPTRKVCFRRFPSVGRRNPTKKPPHFRQFPTDPSETVGSREIRPHWKYFRQKPSETIGNRRKWVGSSPLPSETVGNTVFHTHFFQNLWERPKTLFFFQSFCTKK